MQTNIFALLKCIEQGDPTTPPSLAAIEKQTFAEVVASWGYEWEGDNF